MFNNLKSENDKTKHTYTSRDLVKGILLLALAIMGNYLGQMLGCRVQYILTTNGIAKNIILFFTIYFALTVFNSDAIIHPLETFKFSILLFIGFKLFSKTNLFFSTLILAITLIIYINSTFIKYYKQTNKDHKTLEKIEEKMIILLIVILIIGSSHYLYYQYTQYHHNNRFSLYKYFISAINCKSLN